MGMETILGCRMLPQKQQLCSYIYGVILIMHGLV